MRERVGGEWLTIRRGPATKDDIAWLTSEVAGWSGVADRSEVIDLSKATDWSDATDCCELVEIGANACAKRV